MKLNKYSIGIGDRFAHQAVPQLRAIARANESGLNISPVWNKSNREHIYVGSQPPQVREKADAAVAELNFKGNYFVDADHINLSTVAPFVLIADFFTLDVAAFIGQASDEAAVSAFINGCQKYLGQLHIPGIDHAFEISEELLRTVAGKFLAATHQAAEIYKYLADKKGVDKFVTEVSMDEVEQPQSPVELFFILKMLADQKVPVQTIAPKFTGRFNKGVDYQGNLDQFAKEFEEDILVIDFAVKEFGLPEELKLSVHSGSDKFSIYPIISGTIKKHDKGLHLKTAGTTWLEEVIGLALAGGEALEVAKKIYEGASQHREELCAPYADVIDIDPSQLPSVEEVQSWSGEKYANTLRHIPGHPDYNPNFRQLIHVAYKLAADLGQVYTRLLEEHETIVGQCVEENIYDRHLKRLFSL